MSYRYQIAYSKIQKAIHVFPEASAPGTNFHLIGDFSIDDPNADFEDYADDLSVAIEDALAYVGYCDLSEWLIKIDTYKEGEEVPDRLPEDPIEADCDPENGELQPYERTGGGKAQKTSLDKPKAVTTRKRRD